MPTALKLILVGETIGFLTFSVIMRIVNYRYYKKGTITKADLKEDIILHAIFNVILIASFVFAFPTFTFFSYNKFICTSAICICLVLIELADIIYDDKKKKRKIVAENLMGWSFIFGIAFVIGTIVCSICSIFMPEELCQFKTCISQEETTEVIYPEVILNDKYKIEFTRDYSGKINSYSFYYHDNSNNWYYTDAFSGDVEKLSNDKSSYVEKNIVTKTILNYYLKESDDNYITEEKAVTYKLYINQNELIEIKKTD